MRHGKQRKQAEIWEVFIFIDPYIRSHVKAMKGFFFHVKNPLNM